MQGRPLVFVDIETTGSTALRSRILEIGALRVENGAVVGSYNQLVDPQEFVPGWITRLTGIQAHDTAGQPLFADIADRLAALFENAVFIAHNVGFDYGFFAAEFNRMGKRFSMDKLCTVRLSRALFPGERSHRLDAVIARHGYQVVHRHRAYDDAEVLHRFYHDQLARLGAADFYKVAERLLQRARTSQFM